VKVQLQGEAVSLVMRIINLWLQPNSSEEYEPDIERKSAIEFCSSKHRVENSDEHDEAHHEW
jgi:hypothetical protein